MLTYEYIKLALSTESRDHTSITNRLEQVHLQRALHAVIGLCTETGELMDVIKKYIYYGKFVDIVNIEEEVGDVFWYLAILLDSFHIDPYKVMDTNIAKLIKRYPNKFTEKDATERNLEQERAVLEASRVSTPEKISDAMKVGAPESVVDAEIICDNTLAAEAGVSVRSRMHPSVMHLMQFFVYGHLPSHLQAVSKPFQELAISIADGPQNPETATALRKLLEAKDAAVRAVIAKDSPSS